jgi:hypothetical protein
MAKVKSKKHIETPRETHHEAEADFWAFMTVAAFPLAMLIASSYGATPFGAFLYGAYGSLAVLVANQVTSRKLWMFAPQWRRRFDHPDFSFRLAIISGTILLLLETVLIVFLFTGSGLDGTILAMIFDRHCTTPSPQMYEFCDEVGKLLYR